MLGMASQSYEEMLHRAKEETADVEEDTGERFETPTANIQKEGNRTRITNFSDIADTLRRDPERFAKFLFRELGAAGEIDDGTLLLQGTYRENLVNRKITEYTENYVICDSCNRPDTTIKKERGVLVMKCDACGTRTPLEE